MLTGGGRRPVFFNKNAAVIAACCCDGYQNQKSPIPPTVKQIADADNEKILFFQISFEKRPIK